VRKCYMRTPGVHSKNDLENDRAGRSSSYAVSGTVLRRAVCRFPRPDARPRQQRRREDAVRENADRDKHELE
jgi:hypothetical protein